MKKRLISIAVLLSIITSLFTVNMFSSAATADTNVNKNLLEGMLNNRSWVIDTLINDDYSTNPHAIVNGINDEKSMMATALSQYENEDDPNYSAAYKTMVDTLNTWYHAGDYASDIANLMTNWAADVIEFFGGSESATSSLRNAADTAKNMQYDNILQEVLEADYTASSGQTLSGSNSQLVQLRKISDGVGMITSFISATKSITGLDSATAESTSAYVNDVLIPTADSYEAVMNNVAKVTGADVGEEEQALLGLSKALGMALVYDSIVIDSDTSGAAVSIAPQYLLDDSTKMLIDLGSNMANFASNTMDSYMYISSIQTQKESVAGVMDRTAAHLANADTIKLLNRYSGLIKEAADKKTSNYTYIATMLRNSGTLTKYTEKKTSEALKSLATRFIPCYEESIIPSALASVTGVIGTATFLGDGVTGIKDTSTKTLELKNLRELITFFKATYERDMATYQANPTEENAAKVIDDLAFIQRLRLRGETIAYNMSKNQLEKPLGQIIAGTSDAAILDYYNYYYQSHVDAIIGASVVPFTTDTFTVGNDEILTIEYDSTNNIAFTRYRKADKSIYNFAEPQYRFINGITVASGGTLVVSSSIPISYVENRGGTVGINTHANILEYNQNSGTTVFSTNHYMDDMTISGGSISSKTPITLTCGNLKVSGTPDISNISVVTDGCSISNSWNLSGDTLTVNKSANISGSVTGGNVYFKGDSSGGSGTIENLYISGSGSQNLGGTLNATNLVYNNTGTAKQSGTIYVSGTVKNTSSKVTNGHNTVLKSTGSIIGDHYNSGLALDGITLDRAMTFGGTLKTLNTVNLDDVSITGGLTQSSGTLTLNGDVTVSGDSYFAGTVTQNENSYYTSGDISVNSTNAFNNIVTNGKLLQTITGTINVSDYTNNNNKGIAVANTVNISSSLTNNGGKISGIGMTLLSGGTLSYNTYDGDITIKSSLSDFPKKITGNVILSASTAIGEDTYVGGYLNVNSGSLSVEQADLSVGGQFTISVPLTIDNESSIICDNDFSNSSTITGDSTSISVGGTVANSGTINYCKVVNPKRFTNTGYINNSSINVGKELINSGTINTCNISVESELVNSGTIKESDLELESDLINNSSITKTNVSSNGEICNNSSMSVETLELNTNIFINVSGNSISVVNLSLSGSGKVNLKTNLNVSGTYTNNGIAVDEDKIIELYGEIISADVSYKEFSPAIDITLDGCTIITDTAALSKNIKLINGAKLIVTKRFSASGNSSTIEIDSTSELTIKKIASISSYSGIVVDGVLTFGSDVALTSTRLSGSGTINLKGDLYGYSLTLNQPTNVNIIGKTPQIISCSGANFYNLNISNSSRKGVTFSSSVNCYGEYNKNDSNVSGTVIQK